MDSVWQNSRKYGFDFDVSDSLVFPVQNCSSMHSKKDDVQFGHEIRIQHQLDIPK